MVGQQPELEAQRPEGLVLGTEAGRLDAARLLDIRRSVSATCNSTTWCT